MAKAITLNPFRLISLIIFCQLWSVCAQPENSFFEFVQDQSGRHYSNVPHEVLAFYYGWFGNPKNPAWGKVDAAKH
jgi:hypothetical protein